MATKANQKKKTDPDIIPSKNQSTVGHGGDKHTVDYDAKDKTGKRAVITRRTPAHYIETESGFHGVVGDGQLLPTGEVYDEESTIKVPEETEGKGTE